MTTISVRPRARRAAAAVSSGALALVAFAAVPPAAEAVSPSIGYACTGDGLGTFQLPVVLDTNAPSRMIVGQSTQVIVAVKATLAAAQVTSARKSSATTVEANLTARTTFGTANVEPLLDVPRTQMGDANLPAKDVVLNGTTLTPISFTAPPALGILEVTAGEISGTLNFYDANGANVNTVKITCTVPPGKSPVIDTIAIAASTTTTLTLSTTTSAYGQNVVASAKVTSTYGVPAGDVSFAVAGMMYRAKVDKDGIASVDLPDLAVGDHVIVATFTPSDLATYPGSASKALTWTVTQARTKVGIPVTGNTTTRVTQVGVKAAGVFRTNPTGKVRIKVKRLGKPGSWSRNRTLSAKGTASMRLGVLAQGRYRVVATYRGDANHLGAKKTKTFKVTRR